MTALWWFVGVVGAMLLIALIVLSLKVLREYERGVVFRM